jgi:hypothetical protein
MAAFSCCGRVAVSIDRPGTASCRQRWGAGPVGLTGCERGHSAVGPRQRSLPKAETRRGSVSRLGGE